MKILVAGTSFITITFISNGIKTFSSLVADDKDLITAWDDFDKIFFTYGMAATAVAITLTDGLNLMLDSYKIPIWRPIVNGTKNGTKWFFNRAKSYFTNSENDIENVNTDIPENDPIVNDNFCDDLGQKMIMEGKGKQKIELSEKYGFSFNKYEINNPTSDNQPSSSRGIYSRI